MESKVPEARIADGIDYAKIYWPQSALDILMEE